MRRIRPGRMLLTIFVIGFAIFFGLDLAARGTTRISGIDPAGERTAAAAVQPDSRPAVKAGAAGGAVSGSSQAAQGQTGKQAARAQPGARVGGQAGTQQPGAAASGAAGTAGAAGATGATGAAGAKAQGKPGQTAAAAGGDSVQSQAVSGPPAIVKESFMNHLSNRVGDALHRGAKTLMGVIVSAFDAIIS